MKIKELVAKLEKLDEDMEVVYSVPDPSSFSVYGKIYRNVDYVSVRADANKIVLGGL